MSLKWRKHPLGGHIDLKAGIIDFRVDGKEETDKRRGTIPIPRRLRSLLHAVRGRTGEWVFEHDGMHVSEIKKSLIAAGRRAAQRMRERNLEPGYLEEVHPHMLKHTAVTWLMDRGFPIDDVSDYLATSIATIRAIYDKSGPARARRVAEEL